MTAPDARIPNARAAYEKSCRARGARTVYDEITNAIDRGDIAVVVTGWLPPGVTEDLERLGYDVQFVEISVPGEIARKAQILIQWAG